MLARTNRLSGLTQQDVFGLRQDEATKFTSPNAARDDQVALKFTWVKGGRARKIPIWRPPAARSRRGAQFGGGSGSNKGVGAQRESFRILVRLHQPSLLLSAGEPRRGLAWDDSKSILDLLGLE